MLKFLYSRLESVLIWFFGSLDNSNKNTASGRKISAVVMVLLTAACEIVWLYDNYMAATPDWSLLPWILLINLFAAIVFLAIVNGDQLTQIILAGKDIKKDAESAINE